MIVIELVVYPSGSQYWYKNNQQHRDNNLPAIITFNGIKEWWVNNTLVKWEYPECPR
jgi:hypothetical protein